DNLVWRAAALLKQTCGVEAGAAITLEKNLPIAAGIGGGSADAAAALRALTRLWRLDIASDRLHHLAFRLGADVPACLNPAPVNVGGAGEVLTPGPTLPPLWVCVVNDGTVMPTGPVFRRFDAAAPSPGAPLLARPPDRSCAGVAALLQATRNDLEGPALAIAPNIGDMIAFLSDRPGALGARMSGSGASCFALFASETGAQRAARAAQGRGWWAMASRVAVG
ncbi:MAG: 4-(cytidine 5'-diphospho)-2-C-methyl-D-erythritol kinase, partial [Hyphococcus sp.]